MGYAYDSCWYLVPLPPCSCSYCIFGHIVHDIGPWGQVVLNRLVGLLGLFVALELFFYITLMQTSNFKLFKLSGSGLAK